MEKIIKGERYKAKTKCFYLKLIETPNGYTGVVYRKRVGSSEAIDYKNSSLMIVDSELLWVVSLQTYRFFYDLCSKNKASP